MEKSYRIIFALGCMIMLQQAAQAEISLGTTSSRQQTSLALGRICVFETNSKIPYVEVFLPDRCAYSKVECSHHVEQLTPTRCTRLNLGANTIQRIQHTTSKIPLLGRINLLLWNSSKYDGTLLADEYHQGLPMWWRLRNAKDAHELITYLRKEFQTDGLIPLSEKVFLYISFSHPNEKLLDEDTEFLNNYFTLIDSNQNNIVAAFIQNNNAMLREIRDSENCNPVPVNETLLERALRILEKTINKLESRDITIIIIAAMAIYAVKVFQETPGSKPFTGTFEQQLEQKLTQHFSRSRQGSKPSSACSDEDDSPMSPFRASSPVTETPAPKPLQAPRPALSRSGSMPHAGPARRSSLEAQTESSSRRTASPTATHRRGPLVAPQHSSPNPMGKK